MNQDILSFLFYDDSMCLLSSIVRVNSVMTCDIL